MWDKVNRVKAVKAMEFLANLVNDEELKDIWQIIGIPEGDIIEHDLSVRLEDMDKLDYVLNDAGFLQLTNTFMALMSRAKTNGGIYF